MGLFDDILGKASGLFGGEGEEGGASGLLKGVMGMLTSSESGGLSDLVETFKQHGLGDIISSWISTGDNQPISANQIQQALGSETVQNLAAKAGISTDEVSSMLSQYLPGLIDKLTPDGTIPEGGVLEKGLEFLKGKLS